MCTYYAQYKHIGRLMQRSRAQPRCYGNYGMSAAIVDVAVALGFERDRFIEVLVSGSAQSFALKVAPGFVRKRSGPGATGSFMGLHELLKKDVDHCRELPPSDPVVMRALLAFAQSSARMSNRTTGKRLT